MLLLGTVGSGGGGSSGGFSATVTGGPQGASGGSTSHSFSALTCTTAGGVAPIKLLWQETDDSNGTWSAGSTTSPFAPHVGAVQGGDTSYATYVCIATDSTGTSVTSNPAVMSWKNTTPGNRY